MQGAADLMVSVIGEAGFSDAGQGRPGIDFDEALVGIFSSSLAAFPFPG